MAVDRKARLAIRQLIRAIGELGDMVALQDGSDVGPDGATETPHKKLRDRIAALLTAESQVDPDEAE